MCPKFRFYNNQKPKIVGLKKDYKKQKIVLTMSDTFAIISKLSAKSGIQAVKKFQEC